MKNLVILYHGKTFNINSRRQTFLLKRDLSLIFHAPSVKVATLNSLPPKLTTHSCIRYHNLFNTSSIISVAISYSRYIQILIM